MAKSTKDAKSNLNRRGFLKGAAAGAAVIAAKPEVGRAQTPVTGATPQTPNAATLARETGAAQPAANSHHVANPGSDFMVDVIKSLNIEYLGSNPGSTFESLHESLINYGGNTLPEFLTCTHEENAVAMAHGYYKIEGKPMMALIHGNIGLLHASMAIYNAYADRVPIYIVAGNHSDGGERSPGVQTYHSALDLGALTRDFTKWDDHTYSLEHFAESAVRAYKIAMTPPMGPVLIVAPDEIQKHPVSQRPRIPNLTMTSPPAGDMAAVKQAAKMLVDAERPLITAQRYARSQEAIDQLVELAELLQAPVNSGERINFPTRHPLAGSGWANYNPDVTLGLEMQDLMNATNQAHGRGAKLIGISAVTLNHKSNIQDFGHYADMDLDIGADAEATMPYLLEEVKRLITPDRRRAFEERGKLLAEAHREGFLRDIEAARYGWDASPISLARICAELWPLVKNEDWSYVSPQGFVGNWPNRLWDMKKKYHYIGGQGAGGLGYGSPASVGAALANRKYGRFSINIQTDGDFNYSPGVLWTAAHHRIPLLTIMHNNRGYHQEVMFVEQMASEHNRGQQNAHIGTKLWDPDIQYAKIAEGYGMYSEGPITTPDQLVPALKRGIARVKAGEPALIDVVTQPRG